MTLIFHVKVNHIFILIPFDQFCFNFRIVFPKLREDFFFPNWDKIWFNLNQTNYKHVTLAVGY